MNKLDYEKNHQKSQHTHQGSFMQSAEDLAAIIAIEAESSNSAGEQTTEKLHNSTFILVDPSGAVTDTSKHE